jgi:hypothetical protein
MWRERMRDALASIRDAKDYQRPAANIDDLNDAELGRGIGTPLADAASRADHLLGEIIELYEAVGERPMEWNISRTTTEAVLRNSCTHAQQHMIEYYIENGVVEQASRLSESAVADMRAANAPGLILGAAVYNLACMRAQEEKGDEAIELLKEAFPLRPDIKSLAPDDKDLGKLREDPRFQELVRRP